MSHVCALRLLWIFLCYKEPDDILGIATQWCPGCKRGGSKTQDQNENLWKVSGIILWLLMRLFRWPKCHKTNVQMQNPCLLRCALMFLARLQSGCVVAGPESRGGVHDHRYGHRPGCSGAALHLLYLTQKVRASFHWRGAFIPQQTQLPRLTKVCVLLSLSREYDNLKGSLKSSNEMCEKLKREVLTSNNKVIYMDMLIYPETSLLPHMHESRGVVFFVVAQNITGAYKDQRWHEVSADRSDKRRKRDHGKKKISQI